MKIGTEVLFWVENILTQKITLKKGVITQEVLQGLFTVKSGELFYPVKYSNITSFEKLVRPLVDYLNLLDHPPSYKIIVDLTQAELVKFAGTTGYLENKETNE
jgi:hypothetical protein